MALVRNFFLIKDDPMQETVGKLVLGFLEPSEYLRKAIPRIPKLERPSFCHKSHNTIPVSIGTAHNSWMLASARRIFCASAFIRVKFWDCVDSSWLKCISLSEITVKKPPRALTAHLYARCQYQPVETYCNSVGTRSKTRSCTYYYSKMHKK